MKKLILCGIALVMCVALTACGNSANSTAITSLGNQLDETANTISNVQMVNPTDLNVGTADTVANNEIYDNAVNTQQALLNEEYYKMAILNRTATLKNNISKDLKLSKTQISAVKELTSSLNRYTNSVAYTKNELNSAVKSISSMKKNVEKNADKINAKLNRLACNSNCRSAYYENIINTLDQLGVYLSNNTPAQTTENNKSDTFENTSNSENIAYENTSNSEISNKSVLENKPSSTNSEKTKKSFLTKNIDTYISNSTNEENENCEDCPNCEECPNCPNCNGMYGAPNGVYGAPNGIYGGYSMPNANGYGANGIGFAPANGAYSGFAPANGMYGAYNSNNINRARVFGGYNGAYGANGLGYGSNGFGYGSYGINKFNPSRNTDTYAPMARNIDTYRYGANGVYGTGVYGGATAPIAPVTTEPEQRLEDFEKINDDNTVEKDDEDELKMNDTTETIKPILSKEELKQDESTTESNNQHENAINTNETKSEKDKIQDVNTIKTSKNQDENSKIINLSKIKAVSLMTEEEELNQPIIAHTADINTKIHKLVKD